MTLPQRANQRWSLDFVSDVLADGRRFRVLVVVDDFTRECLALVVDTSISGRRVARELDAIVAARKRPLMIVSDNGTELTAHAMLRWQHERGVGWYYIAPGKPVQNALPRASTATPATNASTSMCSTAYRWRDGSSKRGAAITMPTDLTPASWGWLRTSLQPGPNRTTTRTDSGYE